MFRSITTALILTISAPAFASGGSCLEAYADDGARGVIECLANRVIALDARSLGNLERITYLEWDIDDLGPWILSLESRIESLEYGIPEPVIVYRDGDDDGFEFALGEKNSLITLGFDNNGRVPLEIEEWRFPLDCDDEYGSIDYDFVVDGEVVVVGSIASCAPKGVTIYERVEVPTGGSVTVSLVVAPAIDARFTQVAVNFDPAYGLLAYHGTHRIGPPDVLPKFAIRASPHTVY